MWFLFNEIQQMKEHVESKNQWFCFLFIKFSLELIFPCERKLYQELTKMRNGYRLSLCLIYDTSFKVANLGAIMMLL